MKKLLLLIAVLLLSFTAFSGLDDRPTRTCHFTIGEYKMDILCHTAAQSNLLRSAMSNRSGQRDVDGRIVIEQPSKYGPIVHQFLCDASLPLNTPLEDAMIVADLFGLDEIYRHLSCEPVAVE